MIVVPLLPDVDLRAVAAALEDLAFDVVSVDADPQTDTRRITLADEYRMTSVTVVEDGYLGVTYVAAGGDQEHDVVEAITSIAARPRDLLDAARAGLDPLDREALKTLVRLALAASPFDPETVPFARAAAAHFDGLSLTGDEPVRFTLVSVLSILAARPGGLGSLRATLDRLADTDASDMVRDEATVLRAALDGAAADPDAGPGTAIGGMSLN